LGNGTRKDFNGQKHLKRSDALLGFDLDNRRYDLLTAKTAIMGEIQSVFITTQKTSSLCPIEALKNMVKVTPAGPSDPLFCWRDNHGDIRPITRDAALNHINTILQAWGWSTAFGHSF